MADKKPATLNTGTIGEVFESVIDEIRKAYAHDISRSYDEGSSVALMNAVDIELNFKSLTIEKKRKWLVITRNTKESTMEIRLATRITPPSHGIKPVDG